MKNRIPWILFWAVVMGLVVWNMYSYAGQQHEMEISRKLQAELDVLVKQESTLGENFELMTTAAKSAAKDRLRLVKLLGVCDELDEWPVFHPDLIQSQLSRHSPLTQLYQQTIRIYLPKGEYKLCGSLRGPEPEPNLQRISLRGGQSYELSLEYWDDGEIVIPNGYNGELFDEIRIIVDGESYLSFPVNQSRKDSILVGHNNSRVRLGLPGALSDPVVVDDDDSPSQFFSKSEFKIAELNFGVRVFENEYRKRRFELDLKIESNDCPRFPATDIPFWDFDASPLHEDSLRFDEENQWYYVPYTEQKNEEDLSAE